MRYRPATPDEVPAVLALLDSHGWKDDPIQNGEPWIALSDEGELVGTARLAGDTDGLVYVASVLVRETDRGAGIGSELMRAAMASREGASFYLVCHPEREAFYQRLGFSSGPREQWPEEIVAASRAEDDWDSDHDHLHYYMST